MQIGANGQAEVTALVRDQDGNPVGSRREVTFFTNLGSIDETGDDELALRAYRDALKRNPRLWSSVLAAEKLEAAAHRRRVDTGLHLEHRYDRTQLVVDGR